MTATCGRTAFAFKDLTRAEEAKICALVTKAVSCGQSRLR
jgi:hypothetical protein